MRLSQIAILSLLFVSLSTVSFGQLGGNLKPQIIGQTPNPLQTDENIPVTIQFANLIVVDLNDLFYPNGFTMKLYDGKDYTFQGTTVTPKDDFHGTLTVPVTVNDGKDDSKKFDFKIRVNEVKNVKPVITAQEELSLTVGGQITIEFSNLTVVDPDNVYPDDFTLKVSSGQNYKVQDQTVTPDPTFVGTLTVPVSVHDGEDESPKFNLKITVINKPNVPPVITGQSELVTNEEQSITIALANLQVTDPDNKYPSGFTLKIPQGAGTNYSVSGNTITPTQNFNGLLSIPGITVNDGKDESNAFTLKITVNPVNDAPAITGQDALTTYVNTPITIEFLNLKVSDPDNTYPTGFTMKIAQGNNYTVKDRTITPVSNFKGTLRANVTVNDGAANSPVFVLQVRVIIVPNVAPVITGQTSAITITANTPPSPPTQRTIQFSDLEVTDPDNPYPTGFTLSVQAGSNYTVSGTTITPVANYTGTLSVKVSVNDGTANSNVFSLQVQVVPVTSTPQIIGQRFLMINEDGSIELALTDLNVSDADDEYPKGFTLQIFADPDKQYTVNRNTIIPAKNLFGFLAVVVRVKDDDNNTSNNFNLAILISPVNDPPEITAFEDTPISYEPGADPIKLTSLFEVEDVDNDNLSFAEISIDSLNYNSGYDELAFNNTATIRGVFDTDAGKLSLIGYAPLAEYRTAIRSVTYKYRLSLDEGGGQSGSLPKNKTLRITAHDGQQASESVTRIIGMETEVLLKIPTAFTPNGAEPNEIWDVRALSNAHQCEDAVIRVYNKRGLLLFQSIGLEKKWDGTYNNVVLPTDTYYYTIDLKLSYTKKTYKGVVTILR